ncbi:MAG: NADH-quinone oxidoreductase subunit M, partial [Candidatus Rokubacteria bacterium]|nr:NADH-quinone oxidoreductase subunit M [Candidatus Rokubacteria bacterium]
SLLLVLLTTFLSPLALLSSWRAVEDRVKEFSISMLLLETGMLGVFVSLDLFLFYIFWEAMLIPMYLIIGVWGGPARIYAAIKFILYTLTGSVLMLVAILALYFQHGAATGTYTFDLPTLAGYLVPPGAEVWLFLAFAVAFAIKVPMFPFHTWLPDAHVEAPTAGSVILAGVLLKMGTYGFLRFCLPLFPQASLAFVPWIFLLALVGIVYGAWVSMVQPDLKKLVAYSSVSHLGFVVLGLFTLTPQGIVGGIIQMVNHGLSTGALFLMVGLLYERRHTRLIADFGGLWKAIPAFSVLFMIVSLSSLGLPGLNGFVGEFLILVGAFAWAAGPSAAPAAYLVPVLATSGIIFTAVYMLWMYQRVCFGEITSEANRGLADLTRREWAVLLPVLLFIVWIGVYPRPFTGMTEASVQALITQVQAKVAATPGGR